MRIDPNKAAKITFTQSGSIKNGSETSNDGDTNSVEQSQLIIKKNELLNYSLSLYLHQE